MITIAQNKGQRALDRGKSWFLAGVVFLILWGVKDFRLWYMAGAAFLLIFAACREKSRLQVPWLLEIVPVLSVCSYSVAMFYLRNSRFVNNSTEDALFTETIWLGLIGSACFSFCALWMIHVLIPRGQTLVVSLQSEPMPMRLLLQLYVFGLLLNLVVGRFVPVSLRVVVISFGDIEAIALAIILFQSMSEIPGFGRTQARWALAGIVFWTLRKVADSLFGGAGVTLLCLSCLFSRWLRPAWAVLGLAFLMIFAPLIQGVKRDIRSAEAEERESVVKVFKRNFDRIILGGDWDAYWRGVDQFFDRVNNTEILSMIKKNMDARKNYAYGSTLKDSIFWSLIPRALYKDKPQTGGASGLAREYADMVIGEETSVGVGPISEFYINEGFQGVILGMSIMGVLYGYVLHRMFAHPIQPMGFVFGALTYACVARPETNLADSFGGALRVWVVWVVLCYFLRRQHRSRGANGAALYNTAPQ